MKRKIKCSIDELDIAIAEIEEYRLNLHERLKTLLQRLAEEGIDTATVKFKHAVYDGDNDVTVRPVPVWNGDYKLTISASGETILFIEFGTGVHYGGGHPKAGEFGFTLGGYGSHLGRLDSWRYDGLPGTNGEVIRVGKHAGQIKTHGNPANMAMYDAGKSIQENYKKIAREVFKND